MLSDAEKIKMPGNEIVPRPEAGYRVMFSDFCYRGLSLPSQFINLSYSV
jgi:hypothetical protein